jgi:hypothetical protein
MSKSYTEPSTPLRTISNTATKDNNRKFTLHTVDLADTDAITPAPAHGPSQDKLSSEEKIQIGQIITKLPKDLTDQANLIIRKMVPEAKVCVPIQATLAKPSNLELNSQAMTPSWMFSAFQRTS